ncbi:hypothetical protein K9M16_00880 [Candidatus Babeliales bacterium]|nr:hypothetical protein [Candidatus Babeliales bacterium]
MKKLMSLFLTGLMLTGIFSTNVFSMKKRSSGEDRLTAELFSAIEPIDFKNNTGSDLYMRLQYTQADESSRTPRMEARETLAVDSTMFFDLAEYLIQKIQFSPDNFRSPNKVVVVDLYDLGSGHFSIESNEDGSLRCVRAR